MNEDRDIKCWGHNGNAQLGYGDTENRGDDSNEMGDNMVRVDLGTDFIPIDIEAGGFHVCALSEDQGMKCWGSDGAGRLGIGCGWTEEFGDNLPVLQFPSGFVPSLMGLGGAYSCVVSIDSETPTTTDSDYFRTTDFFDFSESSRSQMLCFGLNFYGELGYEDTTFRGDCNGTYEDISNLSAIDLGSDFEIAQIQIMGLHNCILSTNDELKCFGWNVFGMLGYGDTENRGDDSNEMGDYLGIVPVDITPFPTIAPTTPSQEPTVDPTNDPTAPSQEPTMEPTIPTRDPTAMPTSPSALPSTEPTTYPTMNTTKGPTMEQTQVDGARRSRLFVVCICVLITLMITSQCQ